MPTILFERSNDLWLFDGEGKQTRLFSNAFSAACHPSGKYIAFVRGNGIWTARLSEPHNAQQVYSFPFGTVCDRLEELNRPILAWHPKHPLLSYSAFQRYSLTPYGRKKDDRSTIILSGIETIVAPPPGQRTSRQDTEMGIGCSPRGLGSKGLLSASHPAWSPDGKILAFARGGGLSLASVWELQDAPIRWSWEFSEETLEHVTIEPGPGSGDVMGCGRIIWGHDGRALVHDVHRWNGSSYRWVTLYQIEGTKTATKVTKKVEIIEEVSQPRNCQFAASNHHLILEHFDHIRGTSVISQYDLQRGTLKPLLRDAAYPVYCS